MTKKNNWQFLRRTFEIKSQWVKVYEERYLDHTNHEIDYWRVEKVNSIIIIPVCQEKFLFPIPTFRPGAGKITLDFPGGRVTQDQTLCESALNILRRELNIQPQHQALIDLKQIHYRGLFINSSFSNQKLYSFVAHIISSQFFEQHKDIIAYDINDDTFDYLLSELDCLQCRSLLIEYWLLRNRKK